MEKGEEDAIKRQSTITEYSNKHRSLIEQLKQLETENNNMTQTLNNQSIHNLETQIREQQQTINQSAIYPCIMLNGGLSFIYNKHKNRRYEKTGSR